MTGLKLVRSWGKRVDDDGCCCCCVLSTGIGIVGCSLNFDCCCLMAEGDDWWIWFDDLSASNERIDAGIIRDLISIRTICSINKSARHNAE